MKAVLASGNAHKLEELSAALPDWEVELLGEREFPPEDGDTYLDNARIKAHFGRGLVTREQDVWVLGEDSGIEVAGLGGRPGVHSARFAAGDPVGRLLAELNGVEDRRARYVCELVALDADGTERRGTGMLEGRIATEPRGSEGFGYDPIFSPEGEALTVAELGDDWKRHNSHRARAAAALRRAFEA